MFTSGRPKDIWTCCFSSEWQLATTQDNFMASVTSTLVDEIKIVLHFATSYIFLYGFVQEAPRLQTCLRGKAETGSWVLHTTCGTEQRGSMTKEITMITDVLQPLIKSLKTHVHFVKLNHFISFHPFHVIPLCGLEYYSTSRLLGSKNVLL